MTEPLIVEPQEDSRGRLRDLAAMLALPAMWVDHEPAEITVGLLRVLSGVLRLDGAYARFDDPAGGPPLERWLPAGARAPAGLRTERASADGTRRLVVAAERGDAHLRPRVRLSEVTSTLPGEPGLLRVSASRTGFPTAAETQLLRVAVNQAAIAIHAARRLAREQAARTAAEAALARQTRLLRALAEEVEPTLAVVSGRIREAADLDPRMPDVEGAAGQGAGGVGDDPAGPMAGRVALTHREVEVLGLLAQGLSNKEIAGMLWLSDRTVERHITGLYRKIGVGRRSEATAFALRHGVV